MGQNSNIEWTDHTVNLWWGCAKVHTGCKNCYAEHLSETRYQNGVWGEKAPRKPIKSSFSTLHTLQKRAQEKDVMEKIFLGSMMDIFEASKDLSFEFYGCKTTGQLRDQLFSLIDAGMFSNLIFLFLTKRPELIPWCIPKDWKTSPPKNVWFGTSVSDQKTVLYADRLVSNAPGENLFLSIEPQVGEINEYLDLTNIKWVIQGGESGIKKRPFDIEWAYVMKNYCEMNKVPYFFKQIDKVQAIPEDLQIRQFPNFIK